MGAFTITPPGRPQTAVSELLPPIAQFLLVLELAVQVTSQGRSEPAFAPRSLHQLFCARKSGLTCNRRNIIEILPIDDDSVSLNRLRLAVVGLVRQLNPCSAPFRPVVACARHRSAQKRLQRESTLEFFVNDTVLQIDQGSQSGEATTDNAQTRFDRGPDKKVVEYV